MYRGKGFLTGDVEDVWYMKQGINDFYGLEDSSGLAFRIGSLLKALQRLFYRGSSQTTQPHHIDTSSAGRLDQGISTIIASVLPVLPIVVFYFVQKLLVRIGLILVFTAVFAAVLVMGLQMQSETTLGITTA